MNSVFDYTSHELFPSALPFEFSIAFWIVVIIAIVLVTLLSLKFGKKNPADIHMRNFPGSNRCDIPMKYADGVYEEGDEEFAYKIDCEIAESISNMFSGKTAEQRREIMAKDKALRDFLAAVDDEIKSKYDLLY